MIADLLSDRDVGLSSLLFPVWHGNDAVYKGLQNKTAFTSGQVLKRTYVG